MRNVREEERKEIIVFEDDSILAVNKLAGWIVNKADTTTSQPVLESWIEQNFNFPIFQNPEMRHGIVHRLDKPTSGVLLVAKTEQAFTDLQRQFKERLIQKEYLALVHGKLKVTEGNINAPVGRLPWNRERFGVLHGGREAETNYKVIKEYVKDKENYSLVALEPKTGRTHQIRIHMKYLHHPLVSDTFYAGRKTARKDLKWCPRLFLHAHNIEFQHPVSKEQVKVTADLPNDLKSVIKLLEKSSTEK